MHFLFYFHLYILFFDPIIAYAYFLESLIYFDYQQFKNSKVYSKIRGAKSNTLLFYLQI